MSNRLAQRVCTRMSVTACRLRRSVRVSSSLLIVTRHKNLRKKKWLEDELKIRRGVMLQIYAEYIQKEGKEALTPNRSYTTS